MTNLHSRTLRRLFAWAGLFLAIYLAGDLAYVLYIRYRIHKQTPQREARWVTHIPYTLNAEGSPVLLLIHGFADSPAVFTRMAPIFADNGLAVRVMRLTAAGGVHPDDMQGVSLDIWREDIAKEIAALREHHPERPIWLLGHSLGGTLAFDAALQSDTDVSGLILLAPLIQPSDRRSPVLTSRQWFTILSRLLPFSRIVESRLPADIQDAGTRPAYSTDRLIHRDVYCALFQAVDAIDGRAGEWTGPLWLSTAGTDLVVDNDATTAFANGLTQAEPLRISIQAAAGHVIPLDHGHDYLAGRIARFVLENTLKPEN